PALAVRKISGRRAGAWYADEIGGRSDGHRPHVQASAREGAAQSRDRQSGYFGNIRYGADPPALDHSESGAFGLHSIRSGTGLDRGTNPRDHGHRSLVPEAASRNGG